jgi:hypothetical protein
LCDLLDDLPQSDPWSVYQVHDLIDLLEFGLRKVLGDLKPSKGSVDIGALLRQAHDQSKLRASQLDHAIRAWELRNPPKGKKDTHFTSKERKTERKGHQREKREKAPGAPRRCAICSTTFRSPIPGLSIKSTISSTCSSSGCARSSAT